nr:hypothetical protein [Tanacetum cinerariifolium]
MIANMDADADVVLEETKDVAADIVKDGQVADVKDNADIQGRTAKSQAEIYKIDLDHANKVLSMQEEESEPIELQEVVDVVTTAKIITEVVTAASITINAVAVVPKIDLDNVNKVLSMHEEESEPAELQEVVDIVTTAKIITEVVTAASTTINVADVLIPVATIIVALTLTAALSRRTKGVVIRDPKEATTTSTIIHSEAKSKDKSKGILTEAQTRKNMMVYLKNVAGFKIEYFKGMTYDDIRPIFKKHFDSNVAFLQKTKEQMDKVDSRALKRLNESKEEKAAKKQKSDEEVEELKRHL